MRTNKDKLVMISVQGTIVRPEHSGRHGVSHDGKPFMLPGTGGITYNVKVGDCAFGWEADHVEPGVSTILDQDKRDSGPNRGYNFYACIGNEARVVSGDAKGAKGVVTGHHGGAEHVLIDFPDEVLEKLTLDDKILIKSFGQGLKFLDYPDVYVYNIDPNLLEKLSIEEKDGKLYMPVVAVVPSFLMGSGIGSTSMGTGDYDIMTADKKTLKKYGLDKLRFGDIVYIQDHDNTFGRCYRKGAATIGVVIHSDCKYAGHGPGVTTIMSCAMPKIKPVIDPDANIAKILKIGRYRE
ncbi:MULTISPECIES: DUF4438 domain-containing protein [Pseudothermotoga]|jgi:hypothetical protein|uniref:DUF4438 domain-containing protein n=1 Tax=Pseudothermotoga TaxID=1643951 RepID=UPI00074A159E|nr:MULTISPECIES: DUF4438 domain-containing protein [Pseudothermotoga]KUK21438.1 MAG: Uncharacterized protein XD56_0653 [Pseudothermotoga lettingae]HBJ81333.1 DUF4438 domain-containing protein [Pseudothermotoga sp.]